MNLLTQTKPLFPEILWKRPVYFYKSRAGKLLILAGSSGKSGAAILTSEAAFRSGTGVLTVGFPEGLKNVYKGLLPDAMTLALPETLGHSLAKRSGDEILDYSKSVDLVIIGPGLSQNSETQQLIWELLFSVEKTIVLDADGLNAFSLGLKLLREKSGEERILEYLKKRHSPTILTPHPGEALALLKSTGLSKDKKLNANLIDKNKEKYVPLLADFLNMTVILKGHDTVVAEPNGRVLVNKSGGPELAVAGTGDVLSGIVGSFIALNSDKIFEASSTAVYLHGLAGKLAKEKLGERSVMASDIVKFLPKAIKQAEEEIE
ncbi:NAD(P)H-hydrate dehydratase [bacterium (Candidatus Howlettbacteria) CG_4_10_14_0_8_um_filter_40_9]|nr:MAG: NAD(P)H-hydrate dehydratase [bacterium (Candidatus Howlettbacteria) CG_4_10_14_0_8_um_filter_40_9]